MAEHHAILVVEDVASTSELISRRLRRAGYRALVRDTVAGALASLEEDRPAAVLLDFRLPDGPCWPVLEKAFRTDPRVPAVLLTGMGDEEIAAEALRRGASDYVAKRGDYLERLPAVLERVLRLRRAEQAVLDLERRQAALVAALPANLAVLDESGRIVMVNEAWVQFARENDYADPEHGVGRCYFEVCPPTVERGLRDVLEGRSPRYVLEYACHSPEQQRWYRMLVAGLRREPGAVVMHVDVTEREVARKQAGRLATALEQAADAVLITDATGHIEYANQAFSLLSGFDQEQLAGQRPEFWPELRSAGSGLERVTSRSRDGSEHLLEATVRPIPGGSALIENYVVTLRDVTRQIALEEQLRQSQKMDAVGQLAGGVAHDFNNLLTAILGTAAFLQTELGEDSPLRQEVMDIMKAAESAASLTRQLLTFARRQMVKPEILDLNQSLTEILRMLNRLLGEHIEIVTVFEDGLGSVEADPGQLEQVVMNLAVNARDAMPGGGRLTLSTANVGLSEDDSDLATGDYVKLGVSDTGHGIASENLSRVFEPFFTTKDPAKGTGLGLATVYGIVKQSGGAIRVTSQVGAGSTFEVYLPRVEGRSFATAASPERAPPDRGRGERLLVVEDSPEVLSLLLRLLRRAGYQVESAQEPAEVLELSSEELSGFDLLVSDVVMPRMSGPRLVEELRERNVRLPVIFASGYTSESELQDALILGRAFLAKPFTPVQLLGAVRRVLDETRAQAP